jgi:hypothetical protein
MRHQVHVTFLISGFDDINHEDLEKALDIKPAYVHKKGEPKSSISSALAKDNIFWIGSGLDPYQSFRDQMDALIGILKNRYPILKEFARRYECEISCAAYMRYDNDQSLPSINLSRSDIEFMAELGIEDFDVDLYVLPDKPEVE